MTHYITIRQRYRIYKAAVDMIAVLQGAIYNSDRHRPFGYDNMRMAEVLNEKLLKRVIRAAMSCPGFSPLMKDNIAFVSSLDAGQVANYVVPEHANRWRHVYTLMPNPNIPADVIDVRLPTFSFPFQPSLPSLSSLLPALYLSSSPSSLLTSLTRHSTISP